MTQESNTSQQSHDRVVYQTEVSRAGKAYQAYCPELVIVGFGDTPEEAKSALKSEVSAYLEDCDQLGILDEVLIDAGFYDDGETWISNQVSPVPDPKLRIFGSPAGLEPESQSPECRSLESRTKEE